jgi:hypothetical protein
MGVFQPADCLIADVGLAGRIQRQRKIIPPSTGAGIVHDLELPVIGAGPEGVAEFTHPAIIVGDVGPALAVQSQRSVLTHVLGDVDRLIVPSRAIVPGVKEVIIAIGNVGMAGRIKCQVAISHAAKKLGLIHGFDVPRQGRGRRLRT